MDVPDEGSEIDGFRLGALLHIGSMASIHRLTGPRGPLPLVMKIPRLGPSERAVNVISFEVCRTVLGALAQSPHHPTLVAHGDIETIPYLVMEFIDGVRLDDWIGRAPLPQDEVARLGTALALALDDLHRQDVAHLDLKPTNVLYRKEGRADGDAVLVDFGLAHHGHFPDLLAEELRVPLGNWVYMAPEQVVGVRCDPRSDIYALGAMLYELATGHRPFGKPASLSELRQRLYRDPVPPRAHVPATPPWLQEVILRCLETDARDRYASAAEVAADLANPAQVAISTRGERMRGTTGWALLRRWARARRFEPAPCPPPTTQVRVAPIVLVALAPAPRGEALSDALREATRRVVTALDFYRVACVTVVPPAAALSGEPDTDTPTGRHIKHLVQLRRWAKALDLPDERVTYHVLESEKPASALIDYATMNEVDQIVLGAARATAGLRLRSGVAAQVVAEAPCSVTVVRPRPED